VSRNAQLPGTPSRELTGELPLLADSLFMLAVAALPTMVTVIIKIAIPVHESPVPDKLVVIEIPIPVASQVTQDKLVIVIEPAITMANAVAQNDVSDSIAARSTSVQATFACVMTVYKLGALAIMQRQDSGAAAASAMSTSLRE